MITNIIHLKYESRRAAEKSDNFNNVHRLGHFIAHDFGWQHFVQHYMMVSRSLSIAKRVYPAIIFAPLKYLQISPRPMAFRAYSLANLLSATILTKHFLYFYRDLFYNN